jgi:glucokinase
MAGRVIGFDAGGTKLLGGVVDESLTVHHRVHRTWRRRDRADTLALMVEAVQDARAVAPEVAVVGFGLPARIDAVNGASAGSVHLPIDGVPFRDWMSEQLGLPVFVDNDANLVLLAELRAGAARGASEALMLTLGTGVGGGIAVGGRIYRGSTGAGAELGHMVVDYDGPACQADCPGRGCLEAFVSGPAIGRAGALAAEREPESLLGAALGSGREITGQLVTELAHDGDSAAVSVLEQVGRVLGAGLVSLVNAFDPEVIVIGGGVVAARELLLAPAREVVAERALAPARDHVRIVPAHFADEAGMLGAALLAMEEGAS